MNLPGFFKWPVPGVAPQIFGIPIDFVLFALTLLGVAMFHHHVLAVALSGLGTIVLYKLAFTGFRSGPVSGGRLRGRPPKARYASRPRSRK